MSLGPLYVFFREMSVQVFCPFFNWVVCLPREWIKNPWYIYIMEFYAAERKKELLPFVTAWIEVESIMLRKPGGETQIPFDLTYK